MNTFIEDHQSDLSAFADLSNRIGARPDYVQGGGGNTSVKLDGGLMAVKASGFRLSDVRPDRAYAVLDGAALRRFYLETDHNVCSASAMQSSNRTGLFMISGLHSSFP